MARIKKLERGPLRQKLERMWAENDMLSRATAHKSEAEKASIRSKKTALANEANDLMAGLIGEVVHDARAQLLQIAASLAVADPHDGGRPSSAGSVSAGILCTPRHSAASDDFQVLWSAAAKPQKTRVPKKPLSEDLLQQLQGLARGTLIKVIRKNGQETSLIFQSLSATGMIVGANENEATKLTQRSIRPRPIEIDPSNIKEIAVANEASSVYSGTGQEEVAGDQDMGAATPPEPVDFENFRQLVWESGRPIWQWDDDGDGSKHSASTFWEVVLDVPYVAWIYREAKTRPRCWAAFRKFRNDILATSTYKHAHNHFQTERAALNYLDQFLHSYDAQEDAPNSEADEVPDDDEEYSEQRDE